MVQGKIGVFTCDKAKGLTPDAVMENTMGVKCKPGELDMAALESASEEDVTRIVGGAFGIHFKCMLNIVKALDTKGKIDSKKMTGFYAAFKPADYSKKVKTEITACIKKHNNELKKEAATSAKSWGPMAVCFMIAIGGNCMPPGAGGM